MVEKYLLNISVNITSYVIKTFKSYNIYSMTEECLFDCFE